MIYRHLFFCLIKEKLTVMAELIRLQLFAIKMWNFVLFLQLRCILMHDSILMGNHIPILFQILIMKRQGQWVGDLGTFITYGQEKM